MNSATTRTTATKTAAVASAEAGVSTRAPGMPAATTVASAMLRPQGYRQEKGESRNGRQRPHTEPLYARIASNFAIRTIRLQTFFRSAWEAVTAIIHSPDPPSISRQRYARRLLRKRRSQTNPVLVRPMLWDAGASTIGNRTRELSCVQPRIIKQPNYHLSAPYLRYRRADLPGSLGP